MPKSSSFVQCILSFLCIFGLQCEPLTKYFKPALDKGEGHSFGGIDFIYMINLDQRPEKFQKSCYQLHLYNIYPYRYSAVNGWQLSIKDINDIGLKYVQGMEGGFLATSYHEADQGKGSHEIVKNYGQTYFCHCTARGTIGIYLSHLSVLYDAYNSGYKMVWVMEDDISVIRDPRNITEYIQWINRKVGKRKWDILFTDRDIRDGNGNYTPCHGVARRPDFFPVNNPQYFVRKHISPEIDKIGARFGAHSYVIRRSGMKKILDFSIQRKMFLPYDMEFYLPEGIQLFCITNDLVSNTPQAISDNGNPNYLKKS